MKPINRCATGLLLATAMLATGAMSGCIAATVGIVLYVVEESRSELEKLQRAFAEIPENPYYRNAEQRTEANALLVRAYALYRQASAANDTPTADGARELLRAHPSSSHRNAGNITSPNIFPRFLIANASHSTLMLKEGVKTERIHTLNGHTDWITAVAIDANGQHVATASWDGTVRIWNADTGECLRTFTGHGAPVSAVCFVPNTSNILSASVDGKILCWNSLNGAAVYTLAGHELPVWELSVGPDGKQLVSKTEDGGQKIWDVQTGKCLETIAPPKPVEPEEDEDEDDEDDDAEDAKKNNIDKNNDGKEDEKKSIPAKVESAEVTPVK